MLDRLGLGYDAMQEINPGLVYCALKGFLSGPYEQRAALDEVVQMMGGLAYMTGPEGHPLRAGASVNDVMGGLFGVIAIQAALWERQRTGKGTFVRSGLFRKQHVPRRATHGAVPPNWSSRGADARACICLGDLRRIRDGRR